MPEDYAAKRRRDDLIAKDIAFRHALSAAQGGAIPREDVPDYASRKYTKDMSTGAVDPLPGLLLALEQGRGLAATGKALASGIPDAISAAKSYIPKSLDELSNLPKHWREALQKKFMTNQAGALGSVAPGSVPPPRGLGGPPPGIETPVSKAFTPLPISTPVDPSAVERLHGYMRSEILSGAGAPAEKARALKALEAGRQTLEGYVRGGLPVTKGDLLQHLTPHKSLRPEVEGKLFGI